MPRNFDHGHLHAKADAEIRNTVFAGKLDGGDFSFGTAFAKTSRHQNAVDILKFLNGVRLFKNF